MNRTADKRTQRFVGNLGHRDFIMQSGGTWKRIVCVNRLCEMCKIGIVFNLTEDV